MNTTAIVIIVILSVFLALAIGAACITASIGGQLLGGLVLGMGGPDISPKPITVSSVAKVIGLLVGGAFVVYVAAHLIVKYW